MNILSMWKKTDRRYRITFFSALIMGIISQGMGLFNKFSCRDDIGDLFEIGATVSSGRWGLQLIGDIEKAFYGGVGHYSLPLINGTLSILLIGAAAVIIVSMLDIRSEGACIFTGGLMAAFPVITSIFTYMFTAHYYMFAMFLAVAGADLICRGDSLCRKLLGIAAVTLSIGIYQAFIPMCLCLMVCRLLLEIDDRAPAKKTLLRMLTLTACSIAFVGLYFLINSIVLKATGTSLTDYKGISSMGAGTPLSEYLSRVKRAYREFFLPDRSASYSMLPDHLYYVYLFTVICLVIAFCVCLFRIFRRQAASGILYGVTGLAFPLAVNFIIVMTGEPYTTTVYSQVFPFIAAVWAADRIVSGRAELLHPGAAGKHLSRLCLVYCAAVLLVYAHYDNACYLKIVFSQEEAKSYFTTLVTRIKSTEGYKDEYPVAFINIYDSSDSTVTDIPEFDAIRMPNNKGMSVLVSDYAYFDFLNRWCGFSPVKADSLQFADDPQVQQMPCYPDDGSIRVIDGTVVVKFA